MAAALSNIHSKYYFPVPEINCHGQAQTHIFLEESIIGHAMKVTCEAIVVLSKLEATLTLEAKQIYMPEEYYMLWGKNLKIISGGLQFLSLTQLRQYVAQIPNGQKKEL